MIKLFSWNVNGRVDAALDRQADALLGERPHVVCLQEVTRGSEPRWRERLSDGGLTEIATSTRLIGPKRRRYDHVYASESARAVRCGYREDWLHDRLSDHAAVWVDLDLPDEPPLRQERDAAAGEPAAGQD